MTVEVYRQLQERLDTYSVGFPATKSGVEIEILKVLFSLEDAGTFLAMTPKLETTGAIARRMGRSSESVAAQLETMTEKGLLFRVAKGDANRYATIPFVHGLLEFQVKKLSAQLAELFERYHAEGFDQAFNDSGGMFLRTVPVQASVDAGHNVAAYDDAVAILKEKERIVVADCICRTQKKMVGDGCGRTMEACFMFGSMGQYYLDKGMGREVDVEEAVAILTRAQDDGLVTQPATAQNPAGMCNCCGDCCGVLRSLRSFPNPAEMVFSNHYAKVAAEVCTGCETCLDRCQMDAIAINDDEVAGIDLGRCIGCGLCVTTCPTDAMQLHPKEDHYAPPPTTAEQMTEMARKRGLLPGGRPSRVTGDEKLPTCGPGQEGV